MKGNIIVALVVGAALGFVVGRATKGPSGPAPGGSAAVAQQGAPAAANPDVGKTPADLPPQYLKEADLPAGSLAGMTDAQKYAVLKVSNEKICDCGCDKGSVANCRKTDPNCPRSPQLLQQMIDLAKQGKSSAEIRAAVDKGGGNDKPKPSARPTEDPNAVYKISVGDSPVKGPPTAKVTIIEATDFQWPFCSRVGPTLKQIEDTYGKDVRVAIKMNPLSFHQFAHMAAEAAMAAHEQGKYWEMHDKLFANQQALARPDLEKYAQEIGLDMAKFKQALDTQKFKDRIENEQKSVVALGAGGTPAFFINGRKLSGAQPFERFKAMIDEEMKKADDKLKAGVKPENLYEEIIKNGATSPVMLPGAAQPEAAAPPAPPQVQKIAYPDWSPAHGPKFAKVTILEWSDFQWPFCSRVGPTLKQIQDTYGNDVKIVFRNQPLPFHPNAMPAAKAAMAANKFGKFWQFHDLAFENQRDLGPEKYEAWAKQLGLDAGKWKAAMESKEIADQIQQDMNDGNKVGANGTPAFYINGRELSGAQPFPAFKAVIDEEIKKADELLKKGVKLEKIYDEITNVKAPPAAAPSAAPTPTAINVEVGNSPFKGGKNAQVKIFEFSDFQWPFCSRVGPTLKKIEEEYGNKVQIVFKQFPLNFHPFAQGAAEAALAANEQGKFWEMHDKIFANQSAIDRPALEKYAQELGLDMKKFKAALDSGKFKDQIQKDMAAGQSAGVQGTPSFVINGQLVVGAQPFEEFKRVIDEQLSKAGTAKK